MVFNKFNCNNRTFNQNKITIHLNRFAKHIIQNSGRIIILTSFIFLAVLFYVLFFYKGTDSVVSSLKKPTITDYYEGMKLVKTADSLFLNSEHYGAINNYTQALELLDGDSLTILKADLYKAIGMCYFETDKNAESLKAYFDGLTILKNRDKKLKADINLRIAKVYSKKGLFSEAEKKLNEAKKFYELDSVKYSSPLTKAYLDQAAIYQMSNRTDESLSPLLKAKELNRDTNTVDYAGILTNIAIYHFIQNHNDSGMYYLNKGAEISFRLNDSTAISSYYSNLAGFDMDNGDFRGALKNSNIALAYTPKARNINSQYMYLTNYLNLAQEYEAIGDYKNANLYNKKRQEMLDSMYSLKAIKYIADIENDYRISNKNNLLREAELKKKMLHVDIENRQKQKYLLVSLLILIFILGLYIYKILSTRVIKIELKEEILEKTNHILENENKLIENDKALLKHEVDKIRQELEFNSHVIDQKEALIHDLEEQVKRAFSNENEQEEIIQIIVSLKDGLRQEKESLGIDIMLSEENVKFVKKLKEKHGDISQTEARFCTLLYLNLDTKEIARILSISLDGVRKGRHRLRKKLGLGTAGDITNYLQGI